MIKAVIFDAGGVVIDTSRIYKIIEEIFQPENTAKFKVELNLMAEPLSCNKMTEKEFWDEMIKRHEAHAPKERIYTLWQEVTPELRNTKEDTLQLINRIRKNYKTGLLSNTFPSHAKFMREQGLPKFFDEVVFSCDVNMAKPQPEIYLLAAKNMGVAPEECVFIDDVPDFVRAAEKEGMKCIVFKNARQVEKELRALNLNF